MRTTAWVVCMAVAGAATAAAQPVDPDVDVDESEAETETPDAEQHHRIPSDVARYVPFDGRTFAPVIDSTPGAGVGGQLLDATPYENAYVIDGLDTAGVRYGDLQTLLPIDFLQTIDVVTGGLGADRGGATGAVIAVATRSGGDQTHGSVFAITSLDSLAGTRRTVPSSATIAAERTRVRDADVGAELGGPVIEGALWYYAALASRWVDVDVDRIVRSRVDRDGNGLEDVDDAGHLVLRELERRTISEPARVLPYVVKLSAAPVAGHQGYLSLFGLRMDRDSIGVAGADSAVQTTTRTGLVNAVGSWSSTLRDGRTRIEARVGAVRATRDTSALDADAGDLPQWRVLSQTLGDLGDLSGESTQVQAACTDGSPADPYPLIDSCPVASYFVGGIGETRDTVETRWTGALAATERFEAAGAHRLQAGAELQLESLDETRADSGGEGGTLFVAPEPIPTVLSIRRHVELDPAGLDDCGADGDGNEYSCRYLDALVSSHDSRRWSAFARDRWSPSPGLSLEAGLRYAEQRVDGDLLELTGQWAPRVGAAYDWTRAGRARAFAHWGRYYERVPLELANRSAPPPDTYLLETRCDGADDLRPESATCSGPVGYRLFPNDGIPAAPATRAPFEDEALAGVDVELADWLWVGATYQHRQLGRALEDVYAPDTELAVANPDDADRRYDAVHLRARGGVTDRLAFAGSYSYSSARGRYPGPPGTHIAPIFDLPDNDANLDGPLPHSRPHALQLLGYYVAPLGGAYDAILGGRVTALSGTPVETRGAHWLYGPNEVDLIERGHAGRTDFITSADLQITMRRRISRTMAAELHLAVFNLLDSQPATALDPNYTFDRSVPVSGGGPSDLLFVKRARLADGTETAEPVSRNPDYRRPLAFQDPRTVRVGMRLLF